MPETDRAVPPVVVKKYANRRLYDTESSIYITLDTLADMVRQGREFVVFDAKTGDDITRQVLTQIIVEEETRGRNMLPLAFLRQIIGFYGDSLQGLVPEYLENMMEQFATQQRAMRDTVERTMSSFLPPGMEEVGRQNLAIMDRAMSMFTPFYRPPGGASPEAPPEAGPTPSPPAEGPAARPDSRPEPSATETALREEVGSLRAELDQLRRQLADQPTAPTAQRPARRGGVRS
ncbi:polyhydroxyalkanoate synthesis repressor PhaR [Rhizosaccharibacter radicis]|uniref:Polyhydroxyalkanoate synthesis repressor PhaR n=1 Tax=Rhizosaccharibacter radicis TaxID=2782605 RepID=A0ABT1VXA2_9PROT|nr:polyhydroxyalkanoate synthesis repressor PhaR [Acetobacteraceae bacterium KSS12]